MSDQELEHTRSYIGIEGESVSYFEKLYRNDKLPHLAKLVYTYLYNRRYVVDKAWPSVKRIAKDLQHL